MRIRVAELTLVVILLMNFTVILARAPPSQPHNADAMWVEPSTSNFDTSTTSVGFKFNVTVAMNFTEDTFAWQAVIYYNATQLNCTRVGATAPPTSEFMTGHSTTFSKAINPGAYPPLGSLKSVLAAETCSAPDFIPGPQSGTLFWAEFQIILAPSSGTFNSKFDLSTEYGLGNIYVWDSTGTPLTFTPYDGTYQFTNSSGPPPQQPLSVSISPTSASVVVNQTLPFTSNVTGGTGPYSYQWFLDNTAVSGATSDSWIFSSMINATYAVYLNVTDQNGTVAESNTTVVTVTPPTPPAQPGHDVAIVSVTPSVFKVYQGGSINVTVTVVNNGTFNEVVNVTLYYNITAGQTIGMQTPNINSGQYLTIIFTWNTSNVAYAYPGYTITAVANITNDNTPADNTLSGGTVKVKILGDVNGNGRVDGSDIVEAAKAFGTVPGYPRWNPDADINQDGKIDGKDLVKVALNFGKSFP